MAGTITISTLSDGTNSTSATNPIRGSAKAWVNFNGSGGAVNASYNVSSITVSGTGQYIINMTNALEDTSYSFLGFCTDNSLSRGSAINSTSAFSMQCTNGVGTALVNPTNVFAAAFR